MTYADLQAMFPKHLRPAYSHVVEQGLPRLNEQMRAGGITTPRRIAAFLTTLAFESMFEFNIDQIGATSKYHGRGYIQLTGLANYTAAGKYLGIDLVNNPDLAKSLDWSAKIARWYWTVARPNTNAYADALQMGRVNAMIGYPLSAPGGDGLTNDQRRCAAFAAALKYLTGSVPAGITCTR